MKLSHKCDALSIMFPLLVYILCLHVSETGPLFNVVATQFSMWKYHSFGLGSVGHPVADSVPNADTFAYDGRYFDTYAPGFSLLSFPLAVVGFILDGGVLKHQGSAVLFDELFLAVCASIASRLIYRISLWYAEKPQSLLTSFTLAFGTAVWPFATATYNHDATLVLSLACTYFMLRYSHGEASARSLVLAGLCLGAASLVDYLSLLFLFPLLGYLLIAARERGNLRIRATRAAIFIGALFPVAVLNLVYNYTIFGSALTFPEQYWAYAPASVHRGLLGLLGRFSLLSLVPHMIFNLFSPYRGLFLLSPVLILGFYGLYRMGMSGEYGNDSFLFFSLFITNLLSYSAWDVWAAGGSYGPRFLIYGIPYALVPVGFLLCENRGNKCLLALFVALFTGSSLIQGAGAFTYAYQPATIFYATELKDLLVYQAIAYTFPQLFRLQLGVWWFQAGLIVSKIVAGAIVILVFAMIWSLSTYLTFGSPNRPSLGQTVAIQPA